MCVYKYLFAMTLVAGSTVTTIAQDHNRESTRILIMMPTPELRILPEETFDSDLISSMRRPSVQSEIEMAGSQIATQKKIRQLIEKVDADLKASILPHQLTKPNQSFLKAEFARRGILKAASNGTLKNLLGLSETQQADLQREAEKIEVDFRAKLEIQLKQAYSRLKNKLTKEQFDKLTHLVGDDKNLFSGDLSRIIEMDMR